MATTHQLEREFRLGQLILADPDPALSPEQVLAHYTPSYPMLQHCTVGEPTVENGKFSYDIQRPPVTTKGQDDLTATACLKLYVNQGTTTEVQHNWSGVAAVVDRLLLTPPKGPVVLDDPSMIALP